jgi:ArsR family transcriptional regulator
MEQNLAIDAFSALAQSTRLEVFRLLVAAEPGGLPSGEVARRLGVPHNTMSSHLAILQRAGLIAVERQGRSMIYRAEMDAVRNLVSFLVRDCCNGRPELCTPVLEDLAAVTSVSPARRGCCP